MGGEWVVAAAKARRFAIISLKSQIGKRLALVNSPTLIRTLYEYSQKKAWDGKSAIGKLTLADIEKLMKFLAERR